MPEKVEAIWNAPVPRDVSQLKSYLGLALNYYAKFMPNMSKGLKPLYDLKPLGFGPQPVKKPFRKVRSCC